MSSCECPTCQEVKKEHWTCKHYDDRYEPQLYPCDKCRDYSNWEAKDKPIVVEKQKDTATSPVKGQCENCRKIFPACNGTITIMPQTGHLDCLSWAPASAVVERLEDPDLVEVDANLDCPLDHAALAAEHWDGFTGPLIDRVAEAVKKVAQLGGEEDETDRAIDAVVKTLRFTALSHWIHGAKHERKSNE